jgi:hypothetical protein
MNFSPPYVYCKFHPTPLLSWLFYVMPGSTQEIHEKYQSGQPMSRIRFDLSTFRVQVCHYLIVDFITLIIYGDEFNCIHFIYGQK